REMRAERPARLARTTPREPLGQHDRALPSCALPSAGHSGAAMARGKGAVQTGDGLVSKNRRAFFDYEIEDTLEAGLALIGSEVRSLRTHSADLTDAWIDIDRRGEAWVKSMRIPRLQHAAFGHDDERPRKLLLRREQL